MNVLFFLSFSWDIRLLSEKWTLETEFVIIVCVYVCVCTFLIFLKNTRIFMWIRTFSISVVAQNRYLVIPARFFTLLSLDGFLGSIRSSCYSRITMWKKKSNTYCIARWGENISRKWKISFWMQSLFARNTLESFTFDSSIKHRFLFYFIYFLDTLKCILIILLIGQSIKTLDSVFLTLLKTGARRSEGHFFLFFAICFL